MFGALPRHEGTLSCVRSLEVKRRLDADLFAEVSVLIDQTWRADGVRPLNDHLWLDLREGGRQGFACVLAREENHDHLVGYCQISRGNDSWSVEMIIHPHHRYDSIEIAPELMRAALDIVSSEGGGHLHWWVFEPGQLHADVANQLGLREGRRLLQMRRPLPFTDLPNNSPQIRTQPFRMNQDEQAWLEVNNASFAAHPEQGGWTLDTIRARQGEPWFDPDGFRMYWKGNDLVGFCWTKLHREEKPLMGEIYVIAVHPERTSAGLGTALTIDGMNHLASVGANSVMLYVDADNAPALRMYQRLGFVPHHTERAYVGDIPPKGAP